ncbi:MAG TPA: ATP-binding protein [Flavobacteriales bacterium]|nr:ATP-binding protein [Flavobacteriales bacterium]
MDNRSPARMAWMVGNLSAVAAASMVHLLANPGLWPVLLTAAVVFAVAFGSCRWLVKRFVQEQVDLIHRTVHEARTGRPAGKPAVDELSAVGQEVGAWAEEKHREVAELRERERFRREFIGNLAHELRTPIFSIQGYILTLLEGGLEDPKVNRSFLQKANAGAERMIHIVEDLDAIARLESGVMDVQPMRMELKVVVDEALAELAKPARARGTWLRNEVQEECWVNADRDRMVQVLSNLVGNAIHYGKEGGTCTVGAFDLGGQVLVEVADDGPGIAAEHLPRLFERFYRVGQSRARHEGGSGLGLAIVKHIVEAHGGTITVRSTVGAGTTFGFTLPKVP